VISFDLKGRRTPAVHRAGMKLVAVAVVSAVLLSPAISIAQSSDCLRPVWSDLKPNDKLSIFKRDGSTIAGKLATVDLDRNIVSLSGTGGNVAGNITIPAGDIWQIEYKKAGKIQFLWAVAGFALGGLVGAGLGTAAFESGDSSVDTETRSESALKGAAIGAVGGMLLGALISPLFPSKRTVSCQDPDDPSLKR
jgi:hypothetical protein